MMKIQFWMKRKSKRNDHGKKQDEQVQVVHSSLSFRSFLKIFKWNKQHPETFSIFLSQMLMMHLMCFTQRSEIDPIGISKKFNALVNKNIMDEKIGKAIECDSKARPEV